jgi:NIPSNAP protein
VFTCVIRYTLTAGNGAAFGDYARAWIALIENHGGTHHGYFVPPEPGDAIPAATFSFPGLGRDGPAGTAYALFSFPSVAAYEHYRVAVSADPGCTAATAQFEATPSFERYERTFLVPIFK